MELIFCKFEFADN